ncbi:thiamine pyrophosphokinase [Rhypophila decipiens]|uniref:Thiamine pyrophosphokinase n=1 Tax=Rhypophila decipiens TaxID=261697 RepID=A0AAN6Y726_9PEZI|nr:thiamine pyrophosphokinase [Rhypophila decipiens]
MTTEHKLEPAVSTEYMFEWHPCAQLFKLHSDRTQYTVIVLNQPIDKAYRNTALTLWKNGFYHIAADGGANSVYEFASETENHQLTSDIKIIVGDLDSIRPNVRAHFQNQTQCPETKIIHDDSVDSTDFGKAVSVARETPDLQNKDIVVFGGLGGRVDQALSILHQLHLFQSDPQYREGRMYLYSGEGLTFLLKAGVHKIHVREPGMPDRFAKWVGILPVGEASVISTKGLEWDVTQWPTSFGGQVSTSNHVLPDTQVVEIKTTKDVIFTIAVKELSDKS